MQTAKDLIELCKDKHVTVSSCESLTAGLFTSTLASIPGASAVLKGGFFYVFYRNETSDGTCRERFD